MASHETNDQDRGENVVRPGLGGERAMGTPALAGVRILDISSVLGPPLATALLGDFGAEVIKVEDPTRGDALRRLGHQYRGQPLWWSVVARNKRAVTLNLRTARGQDILKGLVAECDVVVENFRPGTLEKWGLGYEELSKVRPDIILARMTGWGQDGPYADKPAYGRLGLAYSGLAAVTGYPDRAPVLPGSSALADSVFSMAGAIGILLALQHRNATGEGQWFDVSLYEPLLHLLQGDSFAAYEFLGIVPGPRGSATSYACPHNHYLAKDGRWLAIACSSDMEWLRLCAAMDRPDLGEREDLKELESRIQPGSRAEIDAVVQTWVGTLKLDELLRILGRHDVPSIAVNNVESLLNDAHVQSRASIVDVPSPVGDLKMPAPFVRMSATPGAIRWSGMSMGESNNDVYERLLGLTTEQIETLRNDGVL